AVCYSQPTQECRLGDDYQVEGFVSVDLFKKLLPSNNYEYFVCGPPPMMSSITSGLEEWGVPDDDINFEAFGPATVKKTPAAEHSDATGGTQVTFGMSGKSATWQGDGTSILELAEQNGVDIDSGCRAGNCGSCATAIKSGKIKYISEPGSPLEEGTCLVCIAVPDGDVTLNI
ncbi:MAG TPA: 2Fe-2S iron-sulfur cluster binding domain-containing protein, partial [Rhodospirillales bacterium]|nr:2Fe-2S iron-sulfur cluster binding domain-containing protein [Rhodospirillales bacterium]